MPQVGFESMTPIFEREKTFHALDPAAPVIGDIDHYTNITSLLDSI
jgi:hypothetical protein